MQGIKQLPGSTKGPVKHQKLNQVAAMLCHVVEFLMYNLQLDSRFLDVEKKVNYLIFVRRVTFYDIEDRVEHRTLKQAATWLNFWCSNRPLTDTGN